eukprot:2365528-Prymnesium_polylepis.1
MAEMAEMAADMADMVDMADMAEMVENSRKIRFSTRTSRRTHSRWSSTFLVPIRWACTICPLVQHIRLSPRRV